MMNAAICGNRFIADKIFWLMIFDNVFTCYAKRHYKNAMKLGGIKSPKVWNRSLKRGRLLFIPEAAFYSHRESLFVDISYGMAHGSDGAGDPMVIILL